MKAFKPSKTQFFSEKIKETKKQTNKKENREKEKRKKDSRMGSQEKIRGGGVCKGGDGVPEQQQNLGPVHIPTRDSSSIAWACLTLTNGTGPHENRPLKKGEACGDLMAVGDL